MTPWPEYVGYFLLLCFVVAVACAAIREEDWRAIVKESAHFFTMMVVGVLIFSGVVFALEWAWVSLRF